MSTRCNIVIKATDLDNGQRNEWARVILYHHHDGYPEWMGKRLTEFIENFKGRDINDLTNLLLKDNQDAGYEWTNVLHGDIEYLYTIEFQYVPYENTWECDIVLSYQKVNGGTWDELKFAESVTLYSRHFDSL